jgi:hypothetical protein
MVRSEGSMSLKNPLTPPGIDPGTVRLVAQRLNHYANPGPSVTIYLAFIHDVPGLFLGTCTELDTMQLLNSRHEERAAVFLHVILYFIPI